MGMSFGSALMGAHASGERQKLQKEQNAWAKQQSDYTKKSDKKAKGKSLWSSIGGKVGAVGGGLLGTAALTAMFSPLGPAAPALAAAVSAGMGSYAGRKLGEQGHGAQGKGTLTKGGFGLDPSEIKKMQLSKGKFNSMARSNLESQMGTDVTGLKDDMKADDKALHQQQMMASLTDAGTAGSMVGGSEWMGDLFGDASSKYMAEDILGNKNLMGDFDITDIIEAQGT
tara:strand:- start:3572 stop:4252 length:681 start_codon:yes stop_codon:yes gene_type:complete